MGIWDNLAWFVGQAADETLAFLRNTGGLGLAAIVLVWSGILFARIGRRSFQAHILAALRSAMSQMLPLPEALHLEAGRMTDARSWTFRRIADCLLAGMPLHQAIRLSWRMCPGSTLATIQAAESLHQLPQALEALEADLERDRQDRARFRLGSPLYPATVAVMVFGAVTLLAVFILPKFESILASTGAAVPPLTKYTFHIAGIYLKSVHPFVLLGALLAIWLSWRSFRRPQRAEKLGLLSRLSDWITWRLPVVHSFQRSDAVLRTVRALRLSLAAGATVNVALTHAAAMDTNLCYRKRLRKWAARVESGEDVAASAIQCGVGKGIAWAMDGRLNPEGSLDALDLLERLCRANRDHAARTSRTIGWPITIVLLGAIVALTCVCVVEPMAAMIVAQESQILPP